MNGATKRRHWYWHLQNWLRKNFWWVIANDAWWLNCFNAFNLLRQALRYSGSLEIRFHYWKASLATQPIFPQSFNIFQRLSIHCMLYQTSLFCYFTLTSWIENLHSRLGCALQKQCPSSRGVTPLDGPVEVTLDLRHVDPASSTSSTGSTSSCTHAILCSNLNQSENCKNQLKLHG